MYGSDYGYAANNECSQNIEPYEYNLELCKNNNWLYYGENEWTINQSTANYFYGVRINSKGSTCFFYPVDMYEYVVRPVFYLIPEAEFKDGTDGSIDNPCQLNKWQNI